MTEPGEVNGVRFLAGTIIDVQTQDADKLINSGKAVRVDQDGNIVEHHDDDFANSDAIADTSDETTEAIENDTSASQDPDDDTDADAQHGDSEDDDEREGDKAQQADLDEKLKAPTS